MGDGESTSCDVTDFRFKYAAKVCAFKGPWPRLEDPLCLVTSASKHGLVIVGTPVGIRVYCAKDLLTARDGEEVASRIIPLDGIILVSVNCDDTLLIVVVEKSGCPHGFIFQVTQLLTDQAITPRGQVVLGSQYGQKLRELSWNPALPGLFACCLSDGTLSTYDFKSPNNVSLINSLSAANAFCVSWSPRGKQLVTGSNQGALTQYTPELKVARNLPLPPPLSNQAVAVALCWLSSFQFAVVFKIEAAAEDQKLCLCIVNAPKQGPISIIDYDDICYSSGELRPHQFYMLPLFVWGVLLVASANGMEVGVLGQKSTAQQPATWQQWSTEDSARAELPLEGSVETYPIGMSVETSSIAGLVFGEEQLNPMPMLVLLSQTGMLSVFHVLNMRPGAAPTCTPPVPVEGSRPELFNVSVAASEQHQVAPPMVAPPQMISAQVPLPVLKPQLSSTIPAAQPVAQASPQPILPQPPSLTQMTQPKPKPLTSMPVQTFSSAVPKAADPVVKPAEVKPVIQAHVQPQPQVVEPPLELSQEAFDLTAGNILKQFMEEFSTALRRCGEIKSLVDQSKTSFPLLLRDDRLSSELEELKSEVAESGENLAAVHAIIQENQRLMEEIKASLDQLYHPGYAQLVWTRPLDPATSLQLKTIQQHLLYIDSQATQADKTFETLSQNLVQSTSASRFQPSQSMAMLDTLRIQRNILGVYKRQIKFICSQLPERCCLLHDNTLDQSNDPLNMRSLSEALDSSFHRPSSEGPPFSTSQLNQIHQVLANRNVPIARSQQVPLVPLQLMSSAPKPKILPTQSPSAFEQFSKVEPQHPVIPSTLPSGFVKLSSSSSSPSKFSSSSATVAKSSSSTVKPGFVASGSPFMPPPNLAAFPGTGLCSASVQAKPLFGTPVTQPSKSDTGTMTKGGPQEAPKSGSLTVLSQLLRQPVPSADVGGERESETSSSDQDTQPEEETDTTLKSDLGSTSTFTKSVFGQASIPLIPLFGLDNKTGGIAPLPTTTPPPDIVKPDASYGAVTTSPTSLFAVKPSFASASSSTTSTSVSFSAGPPLFSFAATSSVAPTTLFGGSSFASAPSTLTSQSTAQESATGSTAPSTSKGFSFGSSSTIFGASTTAAASSTVTTSTPSASLFGSTASSSSQTASLNSGTRSTATVTSPIFGATTTTAATPILGATTTTTATTAPIFGGTTTTSSMTAPLCGTTTTTSGKSTPVFGAASTAPILSATLTTTVTTAPISSTTTTVATTAVIFGSASTTTAATTPIFGGTTTTTSVSAPALGSSSTSTATTSSIFGGTTTSAAAATSTAGATATPTTMTASSLFGGSLSTPLFGNIATTTATTTSVLGGTATSTVTTSSLFGGTATVTSADAAGTASTASENAPSFSSSTSTVAPPDSPALFKNASSSDAVPVISAVFGAVTSASTAPVFGAATSTSSSTAPIFGAAITSPTSPDSVFGQTPVTTSSSEFETNVFGQQVVSSPEPASQVANLFGGMMGSSGDNMFSSSSFSTPTPKPASAIFGGGASASTPDSTMNLFGGAQACSPFGAKVGESSPANPFGKQSTSSIFGQAPSPSAFGAGSSTNVFGSNTPINTSISGPFSSGLASGSSPFQKSATAFGASSGGLFSGSSFGSTSPGAFGAPPTFGGGPTFGGAPAFGSNVFGGSSPVAAPSFGSPGSQAGGSLFGGAQGNNSFSALASQNTVSFGNLAQQPQSPVQQGFGSGGFGAPATPQGNDQQSQAPKSFAGSSFSSWR